MVPDVSRRAVSSLLAAAVLLAGSATAGAEPRHGHRHDHGHRHEHRYGHGGEHGHGHGKRDRAHTDVLFIGAHPDDEYQSLSTFGQWRERRGLSTGVVTVTRGEGGGNAVGPEEGTALGMIREREEREAVAHAGLRNVFYLDKPDFWYTLSAPLTSRVWNEQQHQEPTDTLERLVRLIRATTPKTVVTMDPRPFDQHGGHQEAARLATEAFLLAGERQAFPGQLGHEGYRPWRPSRLLAQNWGFQGPAGPGCAARHARDPHTGLPVRGYWSGVRSRARGATWAQVERDAARTYRTQGFGSLPPVVTTPREKLECDWFSVLAEGGKRVKAPVREQSGLRPLYAGFRGWARRVGLPWLANEAQPDYVGDRPSTTVREAARAPEVDGTAAAGEYPGSALKLDFWQGDEKCESQADCSATARVTRHGDALYALVRVTDDAKGAALEADDCKRHWRTDAVEIALDPKGASDDTSTTFKTGILPFTAGGGPCAERDGDNRQGPAGTTAPGMRVASRVTSEPYTGYTVEVKIPFAELPATADPARCTANFLVYDSDTPEQKVGQTRLAWSRLGSAQADPYVWGGARIEGAAPPPVPERRPEIPLDAARSENSPPSVAQSRRTGVPLAGGPRTRR